MSVRLLILGLLRSGPLHGYDIKRIAEGEMADWSHVAVGSIYFALEKLAAEGLIAEVETQREGKRPARTVYAITESGRKEFASLLRATWGELERPSYSLDFGIAFMDALGKDEVRAFLEKRVSALEGIIKGLGAHRKATLAREGIPAAARSIFSHHEAHYRAELEWSREQLKEL